MKHLLKIVLLFLTINVYSQSTEKFLKYDFSKLWTKTDNSIVYGFIGNNYQRIRVKIISADKDIIHNDTYLIRGKTMVKNNICDFQGTIQITNVTLYQKMHWGVDNEYKDKGIKKEGVLKAKYYYAEDSTQNHTGVFQGTLTSYWYIDKNGQLKYDDIEDYSDGYRNNQYIGTWTSYKNHQKKVCNWGDYRIPQSGDLDAGAGEFSPSDKYLQFGWQSVRDAYWGLKPDSIARKIEEKKWWIK
jgi:hypothetical protein